MKVALHELSHRNTYLTDITINAFSVLLLNQFPHIQGLQDTILSQSFRFIPAKRQSIQIHHDGSLHWFISRSELDQVLYDSMYQDYVNTNVNIQLASLYRREFPEDLSITVENFLKTFLSP